MWNSYFLPSTLAEALRLKAEFGPAARFLAGGTDLLIDLERGRLPACSLIDLSRIEELNYIRAEADSIRIGGGVTHAALLKSRLIDEQVNVLAQATVELGAPQIRNRSTLGGNIITASPAADTVPPLLALDARVRLASLRGIREIALAEFITGFRQVDLAGDELLESILIPAPQNERRGVFLKLGLRQTQAIAVVNVAVTIEIDACQQITGAAICLGSVAPTAIRAWQAEALLFGNILESRLIEEVAEAAMLAARPIDDIRGSAAYRRAMVKVLTRRALNHLRNGTNPVPSVNPHICLQLPEANIYPPLRLSGDLSDQAVSLTVNGVLTTLTGAGNLSLLQALRDAGLTGTKEGCREGECGACTVLLNGRAVDSCLVPAPAATGCEVVTVEGLAGEGQLNVLQTSFIEQGSIQCGFCTPGVLMAGSAFLSECQGKPDERSCRSALAGNLCRCTGYAKLVEGLQAAAGGEKR